MIELRSQPYSTSYRHPLKSFELSEVGAEIRFDPLTDNRVRVYDMNWHARTAVDYRDFAGHTSEHCPFCEHNIHRVAARFPPAISEQGHLTRGTVTLIPNVLPYAEHAAVAILTKEHIVPMGQMPEASIADGFGVMTEFAGRACAMQGHEYEFAHMYWNYLPASGGSLIHPHMQVYVTDMPLNYHRKMLDCAAAFRRRTGTGFIEAYAAHEEALGTRFVTRRGRCALLAPFAPKGMLGELWITIDGRYHWRDFTDDDFADAAALIADVSTWLDSRLIAGLNLALFASPASCADLMCHIRIYPRVYRNTDTYANDVEAPTLLYGESFCVLPPERTAAELRRFMESRHAD